MPSDEESADQPVYVAAQRFVEVALRTDGSLFIPDRPVWHESVLEDLYARFNLSPDQSSDRFEEKFKRQLAGAPSATIQLAAEVVFVHFLVASDIGATAKRRLVDLIRSWSPDPISIPDDLIPAFSDGVCHTGVAMPITCRDAIIREDLLIYRFLCGHPDPFRSVRDLGRFSVGCSRESGFLRRRSSGWLPAWLPGKDRFTAPEAAAAI